MKYRAVEEAGITVSDLVPIADTYMTPGACTERIAMFCGRSDLAGAGGVFGLDTEHEDLRAFTCSVADVRAALAERSLRNAITVIALQWLCLNRDQLRAAWGA